MQSAGTAWEKWGMDSWEVLRYSEIQDWPYPHGGWKDCWNCSQVEESSPCMAPEECLDLDCWKPCWLPPRVLCLLSGLCDRQMNILSQQKIVRCQKCNFFWQKRLYPTLVFKNLSHDRLDDFTRIWLLKSDSKPTKDQKSKAFGSVGQLLPYSTPSEFSVSWSEKVVDVLRFMGPRVTLTG